MFQLKLLKDWAISRNIMADTAENKNQNTGLFVGLIFLLILIAAGGAYVYYSHNASGAIVASVPPVKTVVTETVTKNGIGSLIAPIATLI